MGFESRRDNCLKVGRARQGGWGRAVVGWVAAWAAVGCVNNQQPPTTRPVPTETVKYAVPVFTPIAGSKEIQEKDGIQITVTPVAYQEVSGKEQGPARVVYQDVERRYQVGGPAMDVPYRVVERTTRETVRITPDRIAFLVTINNNLDQIFRGQGAVVQYNLGGRQQQLELPQFQELSNLILPPRNNAQIKIYGPQLKSLPDTATPVAIMLFGVVTKTDAAGNPTARQNFEWDYSYEPQMKEKQVAVNTVRTKEYGTGSTVVNDPPPPRNTRHH